MKKGIVLLTIALSVSLNAKFSKEEQKILNLTKSADISESFVKNRIDYYKRKDKNIYYTCAEYRFMLGKEESEKNFLACLYFNYYAINKKATKIEKLKKLLNNKFQVYKKLVTGMEDDIVKMNNIYNKLEERCNQLKVNEEYILNIKEDLSWLNKIKSKDKTICKIEKKDGKNILHKLYEYEAKLKESKVANSLKDISNICSKAAFDINGGTYKAIVQKDFYEKYINDIKNKIPENEGCVFVAKTEDNNKVNIIYTGLMGDGDSDASDEVLKKIKEGVQLKQQVAELERLGLMNPTRKLEEITLNYRKKYYKNGKLDIDKYYKEVKKAHKAICLPSSYIDEDTYGLIIKGKFIDTIIDDVKKYHGEKIKEILKMLNDIKTQSKPKAYNMA